MWLKSIFEFANKVLTLSNNGKETPLNMTNYKKGDKAKFIKKFNEYLESRKKGDIWMAPEEISEATGTTESQVVQYIESFDEFVKNSRGDYTIRELYRKHTPFLKRFLDAYNSKID